MYGPTVEDIIEKAKQLCRLDGMLWSNLDLQNPMAVQSRTTRMANVVDRRRYLKRAQTLLETQTRWRPSDPAKSRGIKHGADVRMPDLLETLTGCPKARSASFYDRCKAVYEKPVLDGG
jgi:hypothetical protein